MKVIFWHDINSIHHAPLIESLAKNSGVEVHLVANGDIGSRTENGWGVPEILPAIFHERSQTDPISLLNKVHIDRESISIFSNPHQDVYHKKLWKYCRHKRYAYGFQQARPGKHSTYLGRIMRHWYYRFNAVPRTKGVNIILCNGTECVNWLLSVGYPRRKLLPWGYFPDVLSCSEDSSDADVSSLNNSPFRFIYIGRVIELKRVEWIIDALADLVNEGKNVSLTIVGDGDFSQRVDEQGVKQLGSSYTRTSFVPHKDIGKYLRLADCLVLASRSDEWGAVINEAILCGVPSICSSACNAKDLLSTGSGIVFNSARKSSLRAAMRTFVSDRDAYENAINECLNFQRHISPAAAAQLLEESLVNSLHGKPLPEVPWAQTKAALKQKHDHLNIGA
ncbi:MAG: glycosyltransferase family 4 protein [Desulfuromusa sp.]|nr:glycosyltransferase family 4 protein [Desulfuromusa sp.]